MKSVLIGYIDEGSFRAIASCLGSNYRIEKADDLSSCVRLTRQNRYELVFIETGILDSAAGYDELQDYGESIRELRRSYPSINIIAFAQHGGVRDAVRAVKAGADDYLTSPISSAEVKHVMENLYKALRRKTELDYLRDEFWRDDSLELVQTKSALMNEVLKKLKSVAPTISTVLLTGETGTGKSMFARLIHMHSNRAEKPFVTVHCAAIPDTLLESELFGHEKGAFTGAFKRKLGKFEISRGGTIFLDEIGSITPAIQVKLLQILQDRTFQRVGGEETLKADVRIISATNEDLMELCKEGLFRRDLFYRLNVFPVEIPPLKKRLEDIPILVDVLLKRLNTVYSKEILSVESIVTKAFQHYSWPGNIRELENLMERAYIIETSSALTTKCFPNELFAGNGGPMRIPLNTSLSLAEFRQIAVANAEKQYLRELLLENKGRINKTAAAANIGVRQLHKLMVKHDLQKQDFRE